MQQAKKLIPHGVGQNYSYREVFYRPLRTTSSECWGLGVHLHQFRNGIFRFLHTIKQIKISHALYTILWFELKSIKSKSLFIDIDKLKSIKSKSLFVDIDTSV